MKCYVCMETKKEFSNLDCTHSFCKDCLHRWVVNYNGSCPLCQRKIGKPLHFNKYIKAFPTTPDIGMTVLFDKDNFLVEDCICECINMEILKVDGKTLTSLDTLICIISQVKESIRMCEFVFN